MTDEQHTPEVTVVPEAETPSTPAATPESSPVPVAAPEKKPMGGGGMRNARPQRGGGGPRRGGGMRGGPGRRPGGAPGDIPVESDYEEKNIEIARVTRVTKGGKRMRFRALSVIGNRKGRVGFGLAKGLDVAAATAKAIAKARKTLMTVPLVNETIPHAVLAKFSAAEVLLKPAPKGTGVKAGGAVRIVLELAGIPNVVSKILGSNNKINNVKATMVALRKLKISEQQKQQSAKDVTPDAS